MFYDRLVQLCVERGISSPTAAAMAIGMTGAHVSRWKKGSQPNDTTILKFAQYFNVPPSYFAEEPQKNTPTREDEDVRDYLQAIHDRPELKVMFDRGRNATPEKLSAIIELLGGPDTDEN